MINFLPLEGEAASDGGASMWIMFAVYAVFIAALYLIFFRPQSKRKKKEEQMRKNAQIGDEITTIGGVCGRIVAIKEDTDTLIVETGSDRSKLRIKRWAIGSVDTIHDDAE
ncbi:MAG: preprotein translocase subunit YajC [Acutalibacteraceae bacterium]